MTYVISDLHGTYRKYLQLLELIGFGDEDTLYVVGDICDRGEESAEIYLDVMGRENVFCAKGNHELFLERNLPAVFPFLEDIADPETVAEGNIASWNKNGGAKTIKSLFGRKSETICDIYRFVRDMPNYIQIAVGGKRVTLVHAGVPEDMGNRISECNVFDLLWVRPDYDAVFGDKEMDVLIVGHTPTPLITENREAKIYRGKGNIINIDCGAVFSYAGGRLGCLCLETMEEYYV